MKFQLGLLSKWRSELMGLAAILIIICHLPAHGVQMPHVISKLIQYGGLGVDIFLFLSGLGMSYSLKKVEMTLGGAIKWYVKRFSRLLIPYLLLMVPCFAVYAVMNDWTLDTYLWRLSTLSFWTDGWGLWFVAMLIPLYLVSPFLNKILSGRNRWLWCVLFIISSWLFEVIDLGDGTLSHIQFASCRIPCFVIGMTLASDIASNRNVKALPLTCMLIGILVVAIALKVLLNIDVTLFWIEGLILLLLMTVLLEHSNCVALHSLSAFMGVISLESYCTNVFFLDFFKYLPWSICGINLNPGNYPLYILGTCGCILLSLIINKISKMIIHKIK